MPHPQGLVDTHFHLIPGVDDGAQTLAEAVQMLQMAYNQGTRRIVTTPHMYHEQFENFEADAMRQTFADFEQELSEISQRPELAFLREMRVHLGAENHVSTEFLEALDRGDVLSMNDSDHILIEFSRFTTFDQACSTVDRVREAGYWPILAHIERYPELLQKPSRLARLVEFGGILQVNAHSLLRWGGGLRSRCFGLFEDGFAHIVASDAHNTGTRPPNLGPARKALEKKFSHREALTWLEQRPGKALDTPAPRVAADHSKKT